MDHTCVSMCACRRIRMARDTISRAALVQDDCAVVGKTYLLPHTLGLAEAISRAPVAIVRISTSIFFAEYHNISTVLCDSSAHTHLPVCYVNVHRHICIEPPNIISFCVHLYPLSCAQAKSCLVAVTSTRWLRRGGGKLKSFVRYSIVHTIHDILSWYTENTLRQQIHVYCSLEGS